MDTAQPESHLLKMSGKWRHTDLRSYSSHFRCRGDAKHLMLCYPQQSKITPRNSFLGNHFVVCFMSTHKRCSAMWLPSLKWFCQESNLHKITVWEPLETSETSSNNNSSMQTDGPTTGLGQRTCLFHQMKNKSTHRGTVWLQSMAGVPLMVHSQNSN